MDSAPANKPFAAWLGRKCLGHLRLNDRLDLRAISDRGDRHPKPGPFAVSWRFIDQREASGADNSAGKHGHGRRKDGYRSLKLALSQASVRAVQYYFEIKRGYQRKG